MSEYNLLNYVCKFRFLVIIALFLLFFTLIGSRVLQLSVVKQKFLVQQGEARTHRNNSLLARRGAILDRHGQFLGNSVISYSVWAEPNIFNNSDLERLAKILKTSKKSLHKKIFNNERRFVYLKRQANSEIVNKLTEANIAGIGLKKEHKRYYPTGSSSASLVGLTNIDGNGLEGIEYLYDKYLLGEDGSHTVTRDHAGRTIDLECCRREQVNGNSLVTTIDHRLQYVAYEHLAKSVKKNKANSGMAIVMDPKTGEILAMVNYPSYNPNEPIDLNNAVKANVNITNSIEMGSVIKPFSVLTALEHGNFTPDTLIDTGSGSMRLGRNYVRDIKAFGELNVSNVLARSSNIGVTKMLLELDPKHYLKTLYDFGFTRPSSIGYPGEDLGVINNKIHSDPFVYATTTFGYSFTATPMQLASAYSAIANDGILIPATLIKNKFTGEGTRVASSASVRDVKAMLHNAVEQNYIKAKVSGYDAAGKSGTTKILDKDGYRKSSYRSVFAGFAPLNDPKFVIVSIIEDPKDGEYYGAQVAGPLFANILKDCMRIYNIKPSSLTSNNTLQVALSNTTKN